nr:nucleotide-binding alpha-beta plait domain-containing protein [Tanacetum cinerariifolium]
MGSYRSKEDDVSRISTSIYVSNFPELFSAKELFHSCKQYGHVVDTFIQFKRSKDGKGFEFVRFINVFNVERLKFGYNRNINNVRAKEGVTIDLSKALLGRVKEFASLPNLKIVLKNEGFAEIKIQYMGEYWVLLEFPSSKTKELFQENMGVGSWFSVLKQASFDFIPEGRIIWVEIEGVPFKLWLCIYSKSGTNIYENFKVIFRGKVFLIRAKEVPGWVPEFVDDSDDDDDDETDNGFKDGDAKVQDGGSCEDDSNEVEVPETMFEESLEQKENQSKDPSGIYLLLNKNKDKSKNMKPSDHSLKYPPSFTPNDDNNEFCMHEENVQIVNEANLLNCNMEENQNGQEINSTNKGSKEEISGSVCSGNFKKSEVPRTGGSILCVLEELAKVGQAMGYNMDGCVNNMTAIIESQGELTSERFGSVFNVQGANVFNAFIANAGLDEENMRVGSWFSVLKQASSDFIPEGRIVKEYQENDKIRSEPDKNEKRGEAEKSQKQLQ